MSNAHGPVNQSLDRGCFVTKKVERASSRVFGPDTDRALEYYSGEWAIFCEVFSSSARTAHGDIRSTFEQAAWIEGVLPDSEGSEMRPILPSTFP